MTHRLLLAAAAVLAACQTAVTSPVPVPSADPSAAYEALLQRVVTPDGYVDWPALQSDHAALDAYVAWLSRPDALPDDEDAAHATWLNAYNAWVLQGVLDADVPSSVKAVPGWVPKAGSGFFLERTYALGGQRVSLYTAEHTHIRAVFRDYRDHAALNCASGSCPPLSRTLFTGPRLDAQLDARMAGWVDDPVRGFWVEGDTLVVSPLFDWYAEDFPIEEAGSLCAVLARHASEERRIVLERSAEQGCPTRAFTYDWRLNHPSLAGQRPAVP